MSFINSTVAAINSTVHTISSAVDSFSSAVDSFNETIHSIESSLNSEPNAAAAHATDRNMVRETTCSHTTDGTSASL